MARKHVATLAVDAAQIIRLLGLTSTEVYSLRIEGLLGLVHCQLKDEAFVRVHKRLGQPTVKIEPIDNAVHLQFTAKGVTWQACLIGDKAKPWLEAMQSQTDKLTVSAPRLPSPQLALPKA